ncbi:MAG: hypothetical protein ACRC0L_05920, partial [Angustibacter sp.]
MRGYGRFLARVSVALKGVAAAVRGAQREVVLLNRQWDAVAADRVVAARKVPVSGSSSVNAVESDLGVEGDFRAEEARLERAFAQVKEGVRSGFVALGVVFESEVECAMSPEVRAGMVAAGLTVSGVGSGSADAVRLLDVAQADVALVLPLVRVRVRVAREDAAAAEELMDRVLAAGDQADPADVAELNAVMGRHATDQVFHIEFMKAVGVKKVARFGEYLRVNGDLFDRPIAEVDMRVEVVRHIGVSLVRAGTVGYDGDLPEFYLPDVRQWRQEYYVELKAAGRTRYSHRLTGLVTEDPRGGVYGYHMLGGYFYEAGKDGVKMSTSFAGDVGVDMVQWEREGLAGGGKWLLART